MASAKFKMATNQRSLFGLSLSAPIVLILLMAVGAPQFSLALDVYFPMPAVRLTLPINEKSQSIFSKIPIGRFQVLATSNNSIAEDYIYSLEQNDLLRVNGTTGEVFMRNDYIRGAKQSQKLVLTAISKSGHGELSSYIPHVGIDVFSEEEQDYCNDLEHICFWNEAHYQLMEDLTDYYATKLPFHPVQIGSLNARGTRYLCGNIEPKYTLETGANNFQLQSNFIYTKRKLDHEEANVTEMNMLTALVTCTLKVSDDIVHKYKKLLNITLVDRNDNGPELQQNTTYNFRLDEPHFKSDEPVGSKILFVDKDTMAANAHQIYKVVNDSMEIVKPQCNMYESDHTGRRNTIISCQLKFARNGILSESPYCFALLAMDETIDGGVGGSVVKSVQAHICLHTNLDKIHSADRPLALELRSQKQRKNNNIVSTADDLSQDTKNFGRLLTPNVIDYPKDAYVYREASSYHRVAQPANFQDILDNNRLHFTITDDRTGAFDVTEVGGIVYVKEPISLQHAVHTTYALNLTWRDSIHHYHVMNVHLLDGRPGNATCEIKLKSRTQTCAQVNRRLQCEKFCGLATNGGACVWRGSNEAMFGRNYASCVPDPQFCPDNICDPLEELNAFACPQDCIMSSRIMGPHSTNENKRGILSASGTCTCQDNGKCSCAPIDDEPKIKRKRKNETKAVPSVLDGGHVDVVSLNDTKAEERILDVGGFVCDKSCLVLAASCPLIFIFLIVCLILSRRNLKRRVKGKDNGKDTAVPPGKEATQVDNSPGDCDIRNGDLPLMQLESSFKFDAIDSKWEFERENLVLDIVLGEGEYGKVMKGYATNISGMPGVTTVAVKMLKNGANSVEYMSLLSECQLLQEVSHPNVIKLLGACTKGDSPLIIIEYARHGSLRSYLRLSRKIECSGVDFTDGVEPVTVKQILSFAWQICKGMAYLTEIKLVHRDLAARNVLLADGKICKISDFGLTRDVYEDDAYLKRSRDRVPVKWMAPESLADHVYTTKSDVWAFGVLCWELITLGASPYPGVPPQNLYHLLKRGYRMERPENCAEEMYSIVRSCWADDPNTRPSFKFLASEFEKLLGNNAKYIEMETNAFSNPIYCSDLSKENSLNESQNDLTKLTEDYGEPESLEHLWRPPSMSYDTQDAVNSRELSSSSFNAEFLPPPGYDLPRPLIEAATTEQILRYQNDLRLPLNVRKSSCTENLLSNCNSVPHYSVPVKRGRSYVDMTKKNLIPDNLNSSDFEKHISKTISFRFSSLLNLQELDNEA